MDAFGAEHVQEGALVRHEEQQRFALLPHPRRSPHAMHVVRHLRRRVQLQHLR